MKKKSIGTIIIQKDVFYDMMKLYEREIQLDTFLCNYQRFCAFAGDIGAKMCWAYLRNRKSLCQMAAQHILAPMSEYVYKPFETTPNGMKSCAIMFSLSLTHKTNVASHFLTDANRVSLARFTGAFHWLMNHKPNWVRNYINL